MTVTASALRADVYNILDRAAAYRPQTGACSRAVGWRAGSRRRGSGRAEAAQPPQGARGARRAAALTQSAVSTASRTVEQPAVPPMSAV